MIGEIFIVKWYHIFYNPFFLIRNGIENEIKKFALQLEGNLLDFGCGSKPYKQYFTHIQNYVGLDIEQSGHSHKNEQIDVFYDGKTIPFNDNHFDGIFSSEVFEHVFNIDEVLQELKRVLKPNGKLLISCPFAWPEHEVPYDFARYSSFGIKSILQKNGFVILEQKKTGHFFKVIMQYLILYIFFFIPKKPLIIYYILHQIFVLPFLIVTLLISAILPKFMKRKDLYFNNVVLAQINK